MRRLLTTAAILAAMGTTASAAVLDFTADANNMERGVASGTTINSVYTDFINVTLSANAGYSPYFDAGDAGLGVCKVLNGSAQCVPASDDNVTIGESLTIAFDTAMVLSNLLFVEEGHKPFGTTAGSLMKTLLFSVNGDALSRYTFGQLSMASFTNVLSATFAFDDATFAVGDARGLNRNAEQFYLGAATATPVPVPAALPLLLAGLGGLGMMARRRKAA